MGAIADALLALLNGTLIYRTRHYRVSAST